MQGSSIRGRYRLVAIAGALALALAHPAAADSLAGRILDPQQRVVPDAEIRLFDRASGQVREAVSRPDGSYAFDDIPAGDYVLEARGAAGALSGATVIRVDGPSSSDLTLGVTGVTAEVVVTASSTPLTVQETAKAVDVIDAEELALRNEMSVAEAVRTLPGIRVQSLGGPGSFTTIQTRGMRSHDTAVLIDGMRFRDAASPQGDATGFLAHLATVDTEQIEVMRGSGSSLYGSNAMAGVINITSRTGGGPAQGDVLVEGGGLGLFRSVPSIRGGVADDRLTYSGAVSYLDVTKGVRGANPYRSISPQGMLRYQFTPTFSATGRLWYTVDDVRLRTSPGFPAPVVANFPARHRAGRRPADGPARALRAGRAVQRRPRDVRPQCERPRQQPQVLLPERHARLVRHSVTPGTTYRISYQGVDTNREFINGPGGVGFQPFAENSSHFDGRTDTVQARLDSAFGTTNFFTAGYEFEREQYYRRASGDTATITIASYSHALYAQDRIELLDSRLQLSFGGRVQTFDLPDPLFVGGSHPYGDVNFQAPTAYTGDAAVAYFFPRQRDEAPRARRQQLPRAVAVRALRRVVLLLQPLLQLLGRPRLNPERSVAYDGGIDQWLFDSRLQLSATVFYTDLQETIIFDFANFPAANDPFGRFGGYRNTGGGRARGVEVSAQAAPSLSTNLRVSYTYTDSESETPTVGDDFFGVLGLSKHLFTLTATQWIAQRASVTFDLFVASDYPLSPFGALGRHMIFGGPVKGDVVVRYDLLARRDLGLDLYAKVENLFDNVYYEDGFLTPGAWAIGGLRVRY